LLRWTQHDLAEASGVSIPTVKRLEADGGTLGGRDSTVAAIRAALESAGVSFLDANGSGPGVRLTR
jgi:predicted transcriptional regulator